MPRKYQKLQCKDPEIQINPPCSWGVADGISILMPSNGATETTIHFTVRAIPIKFGDFYTHLRHLILHVSSIQILLE